MTPNRHVTRQFDAVAEPSLDGTQSPSWGGAE
jgi:hypothetical protein